MMPDKWTSYHSTKEMSHFFRGPNEPHPKTWTIDYLQRTYGHGLITENTVIVERRSGHILAIVTFLDEYDGEANEIMSELVETLPETLAVAPNPNARKAQLSMVGLSDGQLSGHHKPRFYDNTLSATPVQRKVLGNAMTLQTRLEATLSPALGEDRVHIANQVKFPMIYPGLTRDTCPFTTYGISKGYASGPHRDRSSVENIFWNTCEGPPDDYGFALFSLGCIVKLDVSAGVSVLVAGHIAHGTCCSRKKHGGIGTVLLQKTTLLSGQHAQEVCKLKRRRV
jgi:hypothetical protein